MEVADAKALIPQPRSRGVGPLETVNGEEFVRYSIALPLVKWTEDLWCSIL